MKKYAGTQTAENLLKAFAGESQTRNFYTFYAKVARREGLDSIAEAMELAADNEREHARIWLSELGGIGTTVNNLHEALRRELYEAATMYRDFAEQARRDGFPTTAALFERTGAIEKRHAEQIQKLLASLESHTHDCHICHQGECRFCGNTVQEDTGRNCPVCGNEDAFK